MKKYLFMGLALVGAIAVALWAYHKYLAKPEFGAPEKAA